MSEISVFCTITAQNGARVPLSLSTDSSPTELRQKVSEVTKIPLAQLRLIFRGRMIKDDAASKVVQEYKLEKDCVLHCMGKPAAAGDAATSVTSSTANLPAAAVPTASAPVAAAVTAPPAQDPVDAALQKLRTSNSPSTYTTAVSTLEKILNNIANNAMEEKYRQVKKQNAAFQKRLGGLPGGDDAMMAAGFVVETVDGNEVYKLNPSAEAWPKLMSAKEKISAAVIEAKQANAPAPAIPMGAPMGGAGFPNMGGMPNMGMGGMPNMGAGGMPNMNDPMMQNMMQNMMSNPEALRNMLQNPMVQQMIQNDPNVPPMMRQSMQQVAQNPAMLQQLSQMMSDPNMRQQMQNMMAARGAGGMPNLGGNPGFGGATGGTTNNNTGGTGTNGSGAAPGNDQNQTEEDMIAEAIRRSLEES